MLRVKKPSTAKTFNLTNEALMTLQLPKALIREVSGILEARGSSIEKYIEVTLLAFRNYDSPISLHDKMPWGKYRGVMCEDLLRTHPGYFTFLFKEGSSHKFTLDVVNLHTQLIAKETVHNE